VRDRNEGQERFIALEYEVRIAPADKRNLYFPTH
ncbi:unnamed protein product, partial [marine sediment metagenome]